LIVSSHCSVAAEVKKIDPTKNTMPSTPEPTSCTKPGNGPIRKQADPKAKSTPIHHDTRSGTHQTPAWRGRDSRDECLRWVRDDQAVVPPSGRSQVT
jgi:hypothetical protein